MIKPASRGFSLISSIIIVVVLAGLSVYMIALSGLMHINTTLNVQSSRAYYAAYSALEWTKATVQQQSGSLCTSDGPSCCSDIKNVRFNIENFSITINECIVQTIDETGTPYDIFDVQVTAERGSFGEFGFVSKQLRGSFLHPPQ